MRWAGHCLSVLRFQFDPARIFASLEMKSQGLALSACVPHFDLYTRPQAQQPLTVLGVGKGPIGPEVKPKVWWGPCAAISILRAGPRFQSALKGKSLTSSGPSKTLPWKYLSAGPYESGGTSV
jgi:hypothetical protein